MHAARLHIVVQVKCPHSLFFSQPLVDFIAVNLVLFYPHLGSFAVL